jgi:signal peptidase II
MSPWLRAAAVAVVVIVLDQATKAIVRSNVEVGDSDAVFPGVQIVHVRNEGVAFSRFSGGGTIVTIIVAAALVALLAYFVTHLDKPLVWLPTGMLIGGALGNIIDRLRYGAVTDFIKFPAWPAFNVADIAITFGVLVLLYVTERPRGKGVRDEAASDA